MQLEMDQSLVDRISALPDDVLHGILAGVGCVRSAARTSILSRRWRGLWTGIDTVTIRDLAPDAIHAALARLARPAVAALDIHVSVPRQGLQPADVDSLLAAAAGLSPAKLAVAIPGSSLGGDADVSLPLPRLDETESLGLEVRGVLFVSPPGLEFPKLETLSLAACAMDLAAMVPRCPKLRVLRVTKAPSPVYKIEFRSASLEEFAGSTLRQFAIDIAAPALKKLTVACNMGTDDTLGSLSFVAPMVEEISIKCWYFSMRVDLFSELWRVVFLGIRPVEGGDGAPALVLPRAHVMSLQIIMSTRFPESTFTEEMEKIPVPFVTVLELKIGSRGHVFGPLLLYLLGIYPAVQKLDIILLEPQPNVEDTCFRRRCYCEKPNRAWSDETVSLISLREVEIKGLRGSYHEVDFLRLIFRSAPLLQRVTVKLCSAIIPDNDWYNTILDTFEEHPAVSCTVCL